MSAFWILEIHLSREYTIRLPPDAGFRLHPHMNTKKFSVISILHRSSQFLDLDLIRTFS